MMASSNWFPFKIAFLLVSSKIAQPVLQRTFILSVANKLNWEPLLLSCLSLVIIMASSDFRRLILCISTVGDFTGSSFILLSGLSESFFVRGRSNNLHVVFRSS